MQRSITITVGYEIYAIMKQHVREALDRGEEMSLSRYGKILCERALALAQTEAEKQQSSGAV